jgi:hypothetical protein
MNVDRDSLLVTFDVENMYPNIEHAAASTNVASFYADRGAKQRCIQEFLDFVMQNNIFRFRQDFYRQTYGTAMGTPVAPPYANLYLAKLERNVMDACPHKPLYYKRFIDDGFIIWEASRDELMVFLNAWNSQHPRIKLTFEVSGFSVHYLDLVITKDMHCMSSRVPLIITTYEKPMNRYLYIPFSSAHNPSIFKGFIKSRLISFVTTNSRLEDFVIMRDKFVGRLLNRGYPPGFVHKVAGEVSHADRQHFLQPRVAEITQQASVPFFTDLTSFSDGFANWSRIFFSVHCKHDQNADLQRVVPETPMIVYRKGRNLQSLLVNACH